MTSHMGKRGKAAAVLIGLQLAFVSAIASARASVGPTLNLGRPSIDSGTFGFEIGNGRPLFKNPEGAYGLFIDEKWEAGTYKAFSEIILPLMEGTPRATVQINVINDSIAPDEEWIPRQIGTLSAMQRETVLPTGIHQVEIRIPRRNGDTIVITINGKPSENRSAGFEKALRAVDSFALYE